MLVWVTMTGGCSLCTVFSLVSLPLLPVHALDVSTAQAMGIEVEMPGGKGILVPNPLKDPADFEARIPQEVDVKDKLSHVIQAVVRIKQVISIGCGRAKKFEESSSFVSNSTRAGVVSQVSMEPFRDSTFLCNAVSCVIPPRGTSHRFRRDAVVRNALLRIEYPIRSGSKAA